ncbi:hypothetical protein BURPS668_A1090 [Burkholderia pseudomallei 668]|nr:hypothetical protein BURPS668_A1090 [Burkholderia pseudomallei 668]
MQNRHRIAAFAFAFALASPRLAARSPCRATAWRFAGLRGCRALPAARRLSD